ncbi:hypothetical protein TgHK011_006170 [Trichoderma gracile]|nr:hypothetical protein TgHK011_006170 [Trichoderma gracile]
MEGSRQHLATSEDKQQEDGTEKVASWMLRFTPDKHPAQALFVAPSGQGRVTAGKVLRRFAGVAAGRCHPLPFDCTWFQSGKGTRSDKTKFVQFISIPSSSIPSSCIDRLLGAASLRRYVFLRQHGGTEKQSGAPPQQERKESEMKPDGRRGEKRRGRRYLYILCEISHTKMYQQRIDSTQHARGHGVGGQSERLRQERPERRPTRPIAERRVGTTPRMPRLGTAWHRMRCGAAASRSAREDRLGTCCQSTSARCGQVPPGVEPPRPLAKRCQDNAKNAKTFRLALSRLPRPLCRCKGSICPQNGSPRGARLFPRNLNLCPSQSQA